MSIPHANYRMQLAGVIEIEKQIRAGWILSGDESAMRECASQICDAMWAAGPTDLQTQQEVDSTESK